MNVLNFCISKYAICLKICCKLEVITQITNYISVVNFQIRITSNVFSSSIKNHLNLRKKKTLNSRRYKFAKSYWENENVSFEDLKKNWSIDMNKKLAEIDLAPILLWKCNIG